LRGLAAALALAVLLGCGEREAEQAAPPAATPAPAASAPVARELQGVRIRRQPDGRLRVRAHRAPRGDVLRELGKVAGFAVEGIPPTGSVDLELESASAEDVLAAVLDAVAHDLEYAPARDEAELVRVVLGPRRARPAAPAREAAPPAKLPTEEAEADPRSRSEAVRVQAGRDPGERLEGEPRELMASLASAADPGTRAAAARALGDLEGGEDAFLAAQALLRSLSDRDPQVLAASITALESLHDLIPDPRHLEAVRRLRDHADPEVRRAATAFLAWTDDER
jgi:hypothetical protein